MCRINFAVVPESTVDPINQINGRYKLSEPGSSWINFPVTVSNPQTPADLVAIGTYDMGIQIITAGGTSAWFDTIAAFSISRSCDKGPVGDGPIDIEGGGPSGDEIIAEADQEVR